MINGWVYHVQMREEGDSKNDFNIEITQDPRTIASFTWYPATRRYSVSYATRAQLKDFCSDYMKRNVYNLFVSPYQKKSLKNVSNCQYFVRDIYGFATGLDQCDASKYLVMCIGTILF